MFYVYTHIREDDKKIFYVGKGSHRRAYDTKRRNRYWKNVFNKHGRIVVIKNWFKDEVTAYRYEKFLIEKYKNRGLANLSDGGRGGAAGVTRSAWHRMRISETHKGRVRSEEELKRMSEAQKGKKASLETRKKLSKMRKGKKRSKEWIEKIAEGRRGKHHTKEGKENIRNSKYGYLVICDQEKKEFFGCYHAAEWLKKTKNPKASQAAIWRACNGKVKSAYGYTWSKKYVKNTRAYALNSKKNI